MALSKIPDLPHTYRGHDYTFVDQLLDNLKDLECPICHSIVSEPLQTSCGHLFCTGCYNKLKGAQCPVCNQGHTTVRDSFNERRVKNLKVRCLNHTAGCDWLGSLSEELQHRTKQDGCQYETIECPYGCGNTIKRTTQEKHFRECPKRPHSCEHCGEEGPYQDIVGEHMETCCKYPVQCPNGCEEKIPREKADRQTKPLKEEIAELKLGLQAEQQRVSILQEANTAGEEQINALKGDITAKERHIAGLEQDTKKKTMQINQLHKDAKAKAEHITQLEGESRAKAERITQLEGESRAKAERITQLEGESQAKAERITQLEGESRAKAERITQRVRQSQAKAERITQLEGESRAKAERITQLEGESRAKAEHITQLEGESRAKAERITQLEGESRAKAERITQLEGESRAKEEHITQLEKKVSHMQRKIHIPQVFITVLILVLLFVSYRTCIFLLNTVI